MEVHYRSIDNKMRQIKISDEIYKAKNQADLDYQRSFDFVRSYHYYSWCESLKYYYMSTADRQYKIKSWQSNVPYGLIRSHVDVFVANLSQNPLHFRAIGRNQEGVNNKNNVEHVLNDISQSTKFHQSIPDSLFEGVLLGTYAFRIGYQKNSKSIETTTFIDGIPTQLSVPIQEMNTPYAEGIDIFNCFPDPRPGKMRFFTERIICSHQEFIRSFGNLISSSKNESPLQNQNFIASLILNENDRDPYDYGRVRQEIMRRENERAMSINTFDLESKYRSPALSLNNNYDDATINDMDLVEIKATYYDSRLVILVNNYPVYVGSNPYDFIPYEVGTAFPTRGRFGPGIGYILRGSEEIGTSFLNNTVDGARITATPQYVAKKSLISDTHQLEDGTPGAVIYYDGPGGASDAIQRLEKGGITDFGLMGIVDDRARQTTGVSEYDSGVSARERTAAGAESVTQSAMRRLDQYLKRYANSLANIGEKWLILVRKYWNTQQFVSILDEDGVQTAKMIDTQSLTGLFQISVQSEGMLASSKSMELKQFLEMYNLTAQSGVVNIQEHIKEIYRLMGYNADRFMMPQSPENIPVDKQMQIAQKQQSTDTSIQPESAGFESRGMDTTTVEDQQMLQQITSNNQVDMGNNGQGRL